ncbi:DUF6478 family protein [Frigidibacter sp. MR17.14]|uniref:DUF6478 family protein n=1 Tax=Frigidibacter sp. MR17.14 TaxID=3126509 RepID=UPI00301308D1
MAELPDRFLDRAARKRAERYWARAARLAEGLAPEALRGLRGRARALSRDLDRVLHVAEGRLAQPLAGAPIEAPLGTDWTWRPEIWSGPLRPHGLAPAAARANFGAELTVFHDCPLGEISLRQTRNTRAEHVAPYGLRLDVLRFGGSFLSLVLDLPEAAVQGLRLRHVVRLAGVIEAERPVEIYARLNVRHGPNTEQIVRGLPAGPGKGTGPVAAEFDLAYTKMNEKRVDRAWLDLIVDGPACNEIVFRDLTLGRRPRSDL